MKAAVHTRQQKETNSQLQVGMIFSKIAQVSLRHTFWCTNQNFLKYPQASPVQGLDLKNPPHNLAVGDECNQQGEKEKGGELIEVVEKQFGQVQTLACILAQDQ